MREVGVGVAVLVAVAIIAIGAMYLTVPWTAVRSFGLPPPDEQAKTGWWLRLKGSRDVVSGLVLLAVLVRGDRHISGVVLLVLALIPVGDMSLVLAGRGSAGRALGVHGLTAAVMVAGALCLVLGPA